MNLIRFTRGRILALILFSTSFVNSSSAQILNAATSLKVQGQVSVFRITTPSESYTRNVVYYLPKSIANPWDVTHPQKTLFFLHGGGASTATDPKALQVAKMYINDFLQFAEREKVILVFPTTPFGWGAPTGFFLRYLISQLDGKLAIDQTHMVLAGHSMGAMGITREYPWLTDSFSGFLALSGGTAEAMREEELMRPYLNGTPYVHINGERDHFTTWKKLMRDFEMRLRELEEKFGRASGFKLIFHPGDHQYDPRLTGTELKKLLQFNRNYFPKYFYSNLSVGHFSAKPPYPRTDGVRDEIFWLKAKDYDDPGTEKWIHTFIETEVKGQEIVIKTFRDSLHAKTLEFKLTAELLNLSEEVTISYNGAMVFKGKAPAADSKGISLLSVKVPLNSPAYSDDDNFDGYETP